MNVNPLLSTAIGALQQVVSSALKNATSSTSSNTIAGIGSPQDSNHLSPFARVMSQLQQLQETNPAQYAQVTAQISTNLTTAAQQATAQGNPLQATQLNQLATDFKSASTTGQVPNVQDLAQAIGGGGHHHHHRHAGASSTNSDSTSTTSSASTLLNQAQSLFGADSSTSSGQNALSIIMNTLGSAQTS